MVSIVGRRGRREVRRVGVGRPDTGDGVVGRGGVGSGGVVPVGGDLLTG